MLTEYTNAGVNNIDLPAVDTYTAVIDHVFACVAGRGTSRLDPQASWMVCGSPSTSTPP